MTTIDGNSTQNDINLKRQNNLNRKEMKRNEQKNDDLQDEH
uniref:Uncharacterized protein n=1 Tax=Tetranychus urticae TaxID=32264 RepID=T1JPZ6_TETUR